MNQYNEPEYDKFIEATPDQSNWSLMDDREEWKPKPRKDVSFYAVDVGDETWSRSSDLAGAKKEVKRLALEFGVRARIRPVHLTEKDFLVEDTARKDELWTTQIYKPSPIRRTK